MKMAVNMNECVIRRFGVPKPWLHSANILYPAPCHPLQPRIAELWFAHELQNLEIEPNVLASWYQEVCYVLVRTRLI